MRIVKPSLIPDFSSICAPRLSIAAPLARVTRRSANIPYVASMEKVAERTELHRLHKLWMEQGGWLLLDWEVFVPEIFQHLMSGVPLVCVGGSGVFESPRWGQVDLNRLNRVPQAYPTNLGQAELFRDLAIVLNRPRLGVANSRKNWGGKENGDRIYRENGWSSIPVSWQHFLWLKRHIDWASYSKKTGYDQFASDHFHGDSLKAWHAASALLTKEEFAALDWGRQKSINLSEQVILRAVLLSGLKDESLKKEDGHRRFASDHFGGNLHIARKVAFSLLKEQEADALEWGKMEISDASERKALRTELRLGLKNGTAGGEESLKWFSWKYFDGDRVKARRIAFSLLSKAEFVALKWKKNHK
jgi:hypothetical protein